MKRLLITTCLVAVLQSTSYGQSDLRKIGEFLENIQRAQNQSRNQNRGNNNQQQPRQGTGTYKLDPNQSGNNNRGDFNRPGFISPQPGVVQPGRPGTVFPNQPYPQGTYPQGTYPQGYQPQPQAYRPQYSEPPRAARRVYSNLPIRIRCAPDCVGICNYQLVTASSQSFPYTIRANQTQTLKETTEWLCRYQPYTGAPYQTYRLRGGKTYEMRRDNNRWQLYMVP